MSNTLKYEIVRDDGEDALVIVNEDLARSVLKIVDKGLSNGLKDSDGHVCIEAAVSIASGEGLSDEPVCVELWLASMKIDLNDTRGWPNPKARARGLRRLAIAQLGSAGHVDGYAFMQALTDLTNEYVAKRFTWPTFGKVKSIDDIVGQATDLQERFSEIISPSSFEDWEGPLSWIEVVDGDNRAKNLATVAELMVQALIKVKSPGTKYLYLTEKKKAKKPAKRKTKR